MEENRRIGIRNGIVGRERMGMGMKIQKRKSIPEDDRYDSFDFETN